MKELKNVFDYSIHHLITYLILRGQIRSCHLEPRSVQLTYQLSFERTIVSQVLVYYVK